MRNYIEFELTNDVLQADPDQPLDRIAIKLLVEVHFVLELKRQQMHQESHKSFLTNEISLVAFAENLVNNVLDDGSLRRKKKLVVGF